MSNVDWFVRKMAEASGQPAPPPTYPTIQPPVVQQPQAPPTQPPAAQDAESYAAQVRASSYWEVLQAHGQSERGGPIAHYWRGGDAVKTEAGVTCPACGTPNFFQRKSTGSRPRCFECGFTTNSHGGGYIPGDQANWAVAG